MRAGLAPDPIDETRVSTQTTKRADGRSTARRGPVERHHATTSGSRLVERAGLISYRAARAVIGRLPARPAWTVLGWITQLTYVAWPSKRHWSNINFAHVLGLPPDDPEVRRLAKRAYRNYARYLVELMRLPRMKLTDIADQVESNGLDSLVQIWRDTGAVILVAAHVGNNEFVAGGVARHGLPINVLADDTAFPEMFDLLKREREGWGVHIVPWRNLREVYGILKRQEMLGLLVDWGYRPDGIPVQLFGAWTTLPAGPAALAGKTGALILPIVSHRRPDGTFFVTHEPPIRVPSTSDADVAIGTQAVANSLEKIISAAPDQWYSFKPLWPTNDVERAALEKRIGARSAEIGRAGSAG